MISKLAIFALICAVMVFGSVRASVAVGDSETPSPQDELTVTRNNLQRAKQKIEELERQVAAAGNLESAKRRIGELILQLHAKDSEIAALRSDAYENAKKFRDDLALQTEELNQAKRRIAEVEQQLASLAKGQELLQAKRRAAEAEQQTVKKDQELAQAKRRVAEVEQQMIGKEQELAQAKRRITEAEQQTVKKDQELAQAKRRVAEVEQQMTGKDQELMQAKRRVPEGEQQAIAAGKDQELAQAKHRAAEAERQAAKAEQELTQVKEELKQVTQKLTDLNPQLMAKDAELARMKQLLADLDRSPFKATELLPPQEENLLDRNPLPLQATEQNLAVTNLLPSHPAVSDDSEVSLSSDLGKMSESLANLLQPELKKGSATLRQRGNKLTLAFAAGELFPTGDATVTLGGASLLERIGAVLHGFRYQSVEVAGYTDNTLVRNDPRKNFRDNIELSKARAEHATQILINGGLEADRVKAVGYVDTKPITSSDTEKGRGKNRRMEIIITQWPESGGNVGDTKTQVGKKLHGFSTQPVINH
jgi:flagellar motor protein MotB